jgi:hypothetical protein
LSLIVSTVYTGKANKVTAVNLLIESESALIKDGAK